MKKLKHITLMIILFTLFTVQVVMAQGTWGNARTLDVSGYSWHIATTEGSWLASRKQTSSNNWDLHTISKTMWTAPQARMVNSNRAVRSHSVETASSNRTVTGTGNVGEIGYNYYGEVKPAFTQIGTDSIRLQLRAR